jgi:3-methyl-2-oxobutanoate hydroxymethyltransferase
MLGMYPDFTPKFARRFADIGGKMIQAFNDYDAAVKSSEFPAAEHCFKIDDDIVNELKEII